MTTLSTSLHGHSPAHKSPPSALRNILTVAHRELRDAIRSRWFLLYSIAFVILGLAVSFVSAAGTGGIGLSGFGRTTAGLVNLVLLVVPLMALTAGAAAIASDRERGMLAYLLAQPISRSEVLLGKYLGLGGALLASIALGLGTCAIILAWKGLRTSQTSILWLAGLSFLLALGMLSLGFLISVLARRSSVAVGTAIFVWLTLVFVTDLALMAGAVALRLRIEQLFALSLANPLQVFKMWSLHAVDASIDVLGPAGLYATEEYGSLLHAIFAGCLIVWIFIPLLLASFLLSRRSPL
ncbi:MAG: ABC transporter permease [Phycisphaeraceae bacterium]|nr:ABC transporter permease [Phycisphaeraceae bacterium]MCW5763553.1 ABC transporter permease [Phycisphaeraceae bacterium]